MVRETNKKHYSKSKPDIGQRKEVQDFSGRAVDEKVRFQHQIIHKGSKLESNHLKGDTSEKKNHIHKKSNDKSPQTHSNNQDANKSTIQLDSLRTKKVNQESSQQSHPPERLQVESRPQTQRRQVQLNQHNSFENQKFSQTQNDNATNVQTSLHSEIKTSFEEDIQPTPLETDALPPELVSIHEDFVNSTELYIKKHGDIESKTNHIQGKSVSQSNQSNVRKHRESPFRRFVTNQSRIVDADSKFSHRRNEGETKLIHQQSQENTSQLRKKNRRIHGQGELVKERGNIFSDRPLSPFETGLELSQNDADSTSFVEAASIIEGDSQFMFGALSSVSYQLTTTSYLSSEEMLIALNHIFSTYELTLSNQLARLKESKPGYDEYIVKGREQIGHDPHVLLAYLTARFGEIKDQASVEPAMRQLYEQMYHVSYQEEKEIRYRTVKEEVFDTSGKKTIVEKRVPDLYRKLIATVSKKDMDGLVHEIFASKPQNLEHYKILRESKGNLEASFPSGTGISLPGNVSSVYDVNLTGGNFPPPNPSHVAALNGGYPGQCTWYVYNRFSQLGKPIQHSPMGNGGEWAFYAAKYGYPVSREARAGTAVCMPPTVPYADPTYGHIAFVERVNPDGSIVISEMNVKGEFVISTGYLPREMAAQCYYINFGL